GIEVARTSGLTLRFPVSLATLGKSRDGAGRPRNWTLKVSPHGGVGGAAQPIKKDDSDGGDTGPPPGGGGVTPRLEATVIGTARKKDDPDGGDTGPPPGGGGVTPRVTATVVGAAQINVAVLKARIDSMIGTRGGFIKLFGENKDGEVLARLMI